MEGNASKTIAEKVIRLRIATRKACMCESADGARKNTLNMKSKFLFCLYDGAKTPMELAETLMALKTNIAIMARMLIDEKLIEKVSLQKDRRYLSYELTDAGRFYLEKRLGLIEKSFGTVLTDEKEYQKAMDSIDEVLTLLSFL